jgi:hypothetical protein
MGQQQDGWSKISRYTDHTEQGTRTLNGKDWLLGKINSFRSVGLSDFKELY